MWYAACPYEHALCTMHCQSICLVPFPSRLITTHTSTTAAIFNKWTDQAANKGGLWCDKEWKLSCRLWVGKQTCGAKASCVADSPCIHTGSNDAAFRCLSLLCRMERGSFRETVPRNTAIISTHGWWSPTFYRYCTKVNVTWYFDVLNLKYQLNGKDWAFTSQLQSIKIFFPVTFWLHTEMVKS